MMPSARRAGSCAGNQRLALVLEKASRHTGQEKGLQRGRRAAYEKRPCGATLTGSGSLYVGSRIVSSALESQQPEEQGSASYLLLGEREADRSDMVPSLGRKQKVGVR